MHRGEEGRNTAGGRAHRLEITVYYGRVKGVQITESFEGITDLREQYTDQSPD